MKDIVSLGLRHRGGRLEVLDQRRLPDEERWMPCGSPDEMIANIKTLAIRGAPLIGVGAALAVAAYVESGANAADVRAAAARLRSARPTAVNLMAAIDRLAPLLSDAEFDPARVVAEAEAIFDEDVALCKAMSDNGAALVQPNEQLLTHCNAGGLATAGIGTAVGVLRRAHELGKNIHVYVDETRPLLQGARLTAWELMRLDIPHTVICDNMAGMLMRQGKIGRIFVGADRIAANGDFANKIGTYTVATLAHHHHVPFHPVAPFTTVDLACPDGAHIPIEERSQDEVRGASGSFGRVQWCDARSPSFNPAFDVTPVALVESLVLDRGVFSRKQLESGALPAALR